MTDNSNILGRNPYLGARWGTVTCSQCYNMPQACTIVSRLDNIQGTLSYIQRLVEQIQYLHNENVRLRLDNNALEQELDNMRPGNFPNSIVAINNLLPVPERLMFIYREPSQK